VGKKFKAILFAPDGEFVTDYKGDTVEEVSNLINDGGSRWIFYPFCFIIKDEGCFSTNLRIIESCEMLPQFKNCTISTVRKFFYKHGDALVTAMEGGNRA